MTQLEEIHRPELVDLLTLEPPSQTANAQSDPKARQELQVNQVWTVLMVSLEPQAMVLENLTTRTEFPKIHRVLLVRPGQLDYQATKANAEIVETRDQKEKLASQAETEILEMKDQREKQATQEIKGQSVRRAPQEKMA